jgi:hypothetical protein
MTITPEKDDVDIGKLFNWGGQFSILDQYGKEVKRYFAKIIGEADLNRARVFALRRSAEMRSKMHDQNSDEFMAYSVDKNTVTKEQLVESTLFLLSSELGRKAAKSINIGFPKEPGSDATLEEQEKYQKAKDDFPKKVKEAANKEVTKMIESERAKLSSYDFDTLYSHYMSSIINDVCEREMISQFNDACIYFGSYRDKKYTKRLFKSMESLQELPKQIKDQFINNYATLEISMDELKKSPGAMQ